MTQFIGCFFPDKNNLLLNIDIFIYLQYVPNKDLHGYLIREDYIKSNSTSPRSPNNNNVCLMLYDEVAAHMEDYDLELR